MSKTFTNYAYEKMLELYNKHDSEVGSVLKRTNPELYKDYIATDCITYSLNVISYSFKKLGNSAAADHVWKLGKHGNELAAYLVNSHKWLGVYINPDVNHPLDRDSEHTYSYAVAQKNARIIKYHLPIK